MSARRLSTVLAFWFAALTIFFPFAASAAIALDNTDAAMTSQAPAATLTLTHTVNAIDNTTVLACVETNSVGGTISAKDNGVSMTLATTSSAVTGGDQSMALFFINATTTGNNVIVFTDSLNAAFRGYSTSYTGVKQTGQPDAVKSTKNASGQNITETITTVADNSWTYLCNSNDQGTPTAGTGSNRLVNPGGAGFSVFDSNAAITPAGNYSMSISLPSSGNYADAMMSFAPVATAATASFSYLNAFWW